MSRHLFLGNLFFISVVFLTIISFSCSTGSTQQVQEQADISDDRKTAEEENLPIILFFGNSLTAGYQLDIQDAFPALIQNKLDTLGYNYRVVNAGLSGETTASGKNRIDWVLREVPDIFFLELGANDGLRGLPLDETKANLHAIIDQVLKANPQVRVVIAGMQVPPNLGAEYTEEFKGIFPKVASQNKAVLVPFLLEGVAGNPELNLSDGIHPTPEGHRIIASTIWPFIEPLLIKSENQ